MPRYLERINEILKSASGKKIMEKKKCVLELLEIYENAEAVQEICQNTETNTQGIVTWSYILHVVHKILLNETDRLANKDVYNRAVIAERQNTCVLVQKTFQHANSSKIPLLKCNDVMPIIFQTLGTTIYEYYHDTYVNVLISYVLPFRMYQVNLLPEHWEELLKICINLYRRISIVTSKRAVLDALQMIIEYGGLHSDLLLHVKDILLFLETVFVDVKTNEEISTDSSYRLTNTVCLQIAAEYRIALCHFSENVLPNIICLKSTVEKYKLLLFFVRIHHPKGVCRAQDGAYADDWEKWYTILKNIYLMILKDIKADILLKSFIHLATEVFRQILENSELIFERRLFDECDYVQAAKRRKITIKVNSPIDMLVDNNPEEAWPIVQILTKLFTKYPECLKSEYFSPFLKIVTDLLTLSCNEENIMDNLYELAAVLLINEKIYYASEMENSRIYWDQIWDILLRSLNVNQNEISTHKLTQLYIINKKLSNPNALLKLYVTNVIKWSIMSARTLIVLCEYFPLSTDIAVFNININSPAMDSNSVRSCLIKWILNIPWQKMATQIIIDELCLLLLCTTLKTKRKKQSKFIEYNLNNSCDCLRDERNTEAFYEHIEQCYLLLKYKQDLFNARKESDMEPEKTKTDEHVLYMQDIANHLMNSLCDIINENGSEDLHIIIVKIAVIAKVISMMKKLNIIPEDIQEIPIVHSMKNYLNVAYTLLENINPSRSKYAYLYHVTKALNTLYGTLYDIDVAKIIVSHATLDMLKNIFSLMNIEDNEIIDYGVTSDYYDYGSYQSRRKYLDKQMTQKRHCNFCNKGIIRIQATKALALFCCANVGAGKCEIQVKLMNNLLKINMYDLSHTVDFKMAITVLKSLSTYGKDELWKNHREIPLENLVELHYKCSKDETALRYILNVLPYLFKYAIDHNCEVSKLMDIMFQFNKHRYEKKYGLAANIEFIRSLCEMISTNPFHIRQICDESDHMPIIEGILSSFNSLSFGVQLQIMRCIREMYSSKAIFHKWKESLFQQIEESANKLIIHSEINNKVKADKKEVTIASTLLLLAGVVSANATFQNRALLAMLRFVIDKKVDVQMISKALHVVTNEAKYSYLIEDNLSYLMTYWFNSKYSAESFPWKLTGCKSEEQFYKMYINRIAFIKFQNLELSHVVSFCNHVNNLTFEQIVENIFPQILSWLLYCINGKNGNSSKKLASKIFHKLITNQDEFSQTKKFTTLFNDKFEEVLTYLIDRLHDEDYLEKMLHVRISFALSDPPHFKEEAVSTCLKYMEENFFTQEMHIQYVLACNCPNVLQKILLYLITNIYKKEFEEHRIKAFHQYIYFCTLIIEKLKQNYFDTLSMYVIKDIGYSCLHIIKVYDDALRNLACKYFLKFIKRILPERNEEVKEIMNFTVITLVSIAQTGKTPVSLEILQFLIIDQKDILSDAIEKLCSFPNVPIFQDIRNIHNNLKYKAGKNVHSLEEEVQHFLNTMVDKDIYYSVEDIAHLRMQLSTRKEELQELYNKLEAFRGFAEDCATSMLHQLVYKLIKLTASSDMDVSIEAVKCLGELGPTDLTSMILYFQKSHVKESSDLMEILTLKIATIMLQFLFQSDVKFRKVSSETLYIVFSSAWGKKLLDPKYMKRLKTIVGETDIMLPLNYIQPFTVRKSSKSSNISINYSKICNIVNPNNTIWTVQSDDSYSSWIIAIACRIAECFAGFYSEYLIAPCTLSTDVCELILPRVIFLIIHTDKKQTITICKCIDKFFEYHFHELRKMTNCDHRIVRCMLNIVNYIRIQVSDNFLNLNYMYIAKAAQYCSAFFTAILYAEMSCETLLSEYNNFIDISKIDYIYELLPQQGKVIQSILRDSYTKIGDFDAIRGTGSSHLQDYSTRIQHYVHTNEWNKVMLAQDVELSFGNMTVVREMANGLHQSGLEYLHGNFISTITKTGEKIDDDIQYECAWRLGNWNFCEANQTVYTQNDYSFKSEISEQDYHFYHYQALKYFHEGNATGIQTAIRNARISIIQALRNLSLESSKTVYEKLVHLQLIREIEDLSFVRQDEYENTLCKWRQQDVTNFNEFEYIEPILTQRTVMLQINDTLTNNAHIKSALFNTYLQISKIAADKENLHIATRSLAVLAKQTDLPSKIQDQLLYQESLLAKLRNDLEVGRFLLRNLINKQNLDKNLQAQILRVYADWMAETKSENPQTVIKKYYLKSIDISTAVKTETTDSKNLHDTQVALARFADNQFEQISSYMNSSQFENLKECVTYSYKGVNARTVSADRDIRSALILNERQNTNDVAELEHIQKEKDNYLILALKYYLIALEQSENYNLLVFRVVALWLDNMHQQEVNDILQQNLHKIASFKFIPLVPQLAAHMNVELNNFSGKIYNIMQRCALEHPHHTLPVLLALKNLYGDYDYNSSRQCKSVEPRVLGARKLLQELGNSNISLIVQEMEMLSHALVMLANLATSANKPGSVVKLPRNQELLKVKLFEKISVPTLTIHVRPSRNYSDIIGVAKYAETYETVGGVNTPKKLVCIGTDGIHRHQLIKGKDDLRQDAVMQQVFNVMNTLLKAYKETKRRKLHIRTYKVVPLTQRSGILEWCDNTIPIITVLIGSNSSHGLHNKYYPNDYTANTCREKLTAVGKSSTDIKLKVFMDCCAHMHPVMHHFFIEKYPSPETWFERRLAYTRSIATTSMAGYILGLGDRHLSNILIDETTAEVIHIDFGIAFEQGKVLPVPETIPFRLTRNIEVGMGVSGVEGTMRHCCEKTLTVLRDQRQIIITLLQVLLYDPLFKWSITPAKAHDIQSGSSSHLIEINQCSTGTNKTAERALLRIEQKLRGTEEGLASSVSGQAERLIQQARDPINLCRLYVGWQPYL